MPDGRRTRVVILGTGFGGVYTADHLDGRVDPAKVEVILVGRDNFFLMTPLLFEAGSGDLEFRHAVNPVRPLLRHTRFYNATIEHVDLAAKEVHARSAAGDRYSLPYDHLVLAVGQITDKRRIPGAEHALTFKTIVDAITFRNHVIEAFERADAATDPAARARDLTFVVVGGGLVGVELCGEMSEFVDRLLRAYPRITRKEVRVVLLQRGPRLLPELNEKSGRYAEKRLTKSGVTVRTGTGVERIEPDRVHLPGGEEVEAATVILSAGLAPNPLVAGLDLPRTRDRVTTDGCMRVAGHPGVWAIGDCAAIPGPDGQPYPTLAQHALREAKQLAKNIAAVIDGKEPAPFVYQMLGTMAALGHYRGIASVKGITVRGFLAWWAWRTYYLFQTPGLGRKVRILLEWTVALFFRQDVVKIGLSDELGNPTPADGKPGPTKAPGEPTPATR
ncbi:MAG: NAD(P)/FAD-dependent oxidoreductase [Gemmataceae bacterium]|nr:NAD(P)/FAD-dependent oxidoreductase [Gemmataceae bacterium]